MAGTILTNIGLSKLAAATPQNQLNITHIAVGDGNGGFPTLSPSATALTNEVWRGDASNPVKDASNTKYVYFETNIPPEAGPFDVREIACFDSDGDMIAIGHTSLIQKPNPTDDASFAVAVKIFIALENASDFDLIYQNIEATSHNSLLDRNAAEAHDDTAIKRFTTTGLINGSFHSVSAGESVNTIGFYNIFDGGNFNWVKTSGVDTPSQSPLYFGEAKLTDADGSVWVPATKDIVFVEMFGAPSLETVKISINYADNSGATSVRSAFKSSFEIPSTLEVVCSDLSILLDYSIEIASSSGDSVVTVHSSSNVDLWIRDIVGNRATSSAGDAFVGANGVIVTNSENVTVRKSTIRSVLNQGLVFTGNSEGAAGGVAAANIGPVSKCYAYDNTITDIGNGALIFQTGEIGIATGNTCNLFENEGIQFIDEWDSGLAHDNTIVSGSSAAIALEQHSGRGVSSPVKNIIITNNNIKSNWHGIVLEHNAGEFDNIIIDSNVINLNSSSGLSLGGIITTNAGVMVDNIVITNNVITGVAGSKLNFGVRFYKPGDNSGYAGNVIINDNVMEFLKGGVFISGGDSNDALTMTGNRIANASIAISVDDRSGAVINNNHISLCNDTFIRIGATLGNNVRGVSISNNSLSVPNSALTDGILIDNSGSGNISEYQVKNNYVNVSAASSATPINDLVGSGTAQIYGNITLPETSSSFAADKKVTVDQIDSDTDKVLNVGYASLGANLLATADPDTVSQTYKSRVSSTAPGIAKMPNTGFWALDSSVYDANSGHQLAKDIFNRSMFHRSKSSGSWDADWIKIHDDENTNFTTFRGGNVGDQIGSVIYRNTTTLFLVKDISGYINSPSSITCTGTFKIVNQNGVSIITGIAASDLSMESLTSSKRLKVRISNVDPTLLTFGGDTTYELAAETADATIEANL